jgi:hypothetical protein
MIARCLGTVPYRSAHEHKYLSRDYLQIILNIEGDSRIGQNPVCVFMALLPFPFIYVSCYYM